MDNGVPETAFNPREIFKNNEVPEKASEPKRFILR